MDWLDILAKVTTVLAGLSVGISALIAAFNYKSQQKIRRAEWVTSLFEKFFENPGFKEARVWLDYGKLNAKLKVLDDEEKIVNEEKFTDFLNFFEYIGVLYYRNRLTFEEIYEVFDYYLKKIKVDPDCQDWITKFGFEKLKSLLNELK